MTALGALVEEGLVRTDVPLGPLTTYKFGGNARHFAELERTEEILRLAAALREEPGSFLVLGRGSNIVVSDTGFPGIVLRLGRGFTWSEISTEGSVSAGAAASLPLLAWEAARAGRGGLEFFVGVPGSVGGGVRMNAGCHGSEM
ncbi:MAG: FAD-binding protein, partial [Acidimicrobiia bacterium]